MACKYCWALYNLENKIALNCRKRLCWCQFEIDTFLTNAQTCSAATL